MRRLWNANPLVSFTEINKGLYLIELMIRREVETILNNGLCSIGMIWWQSQHVTQLSNLQGVM